VTAERPLPAAVLFDYDGTLVDTEVYWMHAEVDLLATYGVPWTLEDAAQLCGSSREHSIAVHMRRMREFGVDTSAIDPDGLYDRMSELVVENIRRLGLPMLPGAQELLLDLKHNGVPCGLVSNSPPQVLQAGLSSFPAGCITLVIDGDMVARGKPDPEGYLMAAERLGVDPRRCLVVEDTPIGAQAGGAAGAVVLAVPGQFPVPPAPRQINLPGLVGLDWARLCDIYAKVCAS